MTPNQESLIAKYLSDRVNYTCGFSFRNIDGIDYINHDSTFYKIIVCDQGIRVINSHEKKGLKELAAGKANFTGVVFVDRNYTPINCEEFDIIK